MGAVGTMDQSEEAQSLLSKAGETSPNETPTHQPRGLHDIRDRNIGPPPPYPPGSYSPQPPGSYPPPVAAIPPTSQLQRVINNTLQKSSESKMLSETIC